MKIIGDLVHLVIRTRLRVLIKHVSVGKKSTKVHLWDWLKEYQDITLLHCTLRMGEGFESKEYIPIKHRISSKRVRGPNGDHETRCTQQRRKQELAARAAMCSNEHKQEYTLCLRFLLVMLAYSLETSMSYFCLYTSSRSLFSVPNSCL